MTVGDPDLTCPTCQGTDRVPPGDPEGLGCWDCADGRRQPTLDEWDTLCAERDTLLLALAQHGPKPDEWRSR